MNTPISTSYRDYPTVNVSLLDDSEAEPETLPTESKTLTQEVLLDTLWALHGDCYLWSRDQRVPDAVATFLRRCRLFIGLISVAMVLSMLTTLCSQIRR
jgi:hypothetical protein